MELGITTLIIVSSLVLVTQVITLFVQYKGNRDYKSVRHWLIGSSLMALGFILVPFLPLENFYKIAVIENPLQVLGHIFLYLGVKEFFNKKTNKFIPISIFLVFNLIYYYFIFINNSIYARTIIISSAIAIISFMIAYELFFKKDKFIFGSINYTTAIFLIYGSLNIIRVFYIVILDPKNSYIDQGYIIIVTMIFSIIISNLWTLGFIIMINQRLNVENQWEKEKLQLIFNTSIDAQLITQFDDGWIVDVNDEFVRLSGYSKDEIIGSSTRQNVFWYNLEDRQYLISELNDKGSCENLEFIFQRKDQSQFIGIISAKIIKIHSITHIISVIRDITKRKLIESEMEKLVKQLEIERNIAQLNAITDSLTGLFNRGYFDNTFRNEFFRLMRSGSPLSLIMLDIDHFKKFNDSYGHLAGDKCIQMISTTLKNTLKRPADIAARYGGEEFIAILPDTDKNGAKIMGETIRKEIENLSIPHIASETAKYVTVSVGIVTVYPSELISPDQTLKLVDEALYSAKEKGRNCYVFYS